MKKIKIALILLSLLSLAASTDGFQYHTDIRWYDTGTKTFSGEKFNSGGLTYASFSDKIGTVSRVEWKGHHVDVRCNDRGPNEVELTRGAFERLEFTDVGVLRNAKVTIIK